MTEQSTSAPKSDAKPKASEKAGESETVTLQLGKGERVEVTKPSAEYTQLVHGYGYKEV